MRRILTGLVLSLGLLGLSAEPLSASEVPLGTSGGIYTVPVQINGSVAMKFLVDPGAGVVVIPLSVLRDLVQNGTVTENDVIGVGAAETADRSLYLTARVRLAELRIGDTIVRDVTAAVAPGLTRPLLGQSFLRRFAAVTFDNRRHVLILSNEAPPVAQAPPAPWPAPEQAPLTGGGYGSPYYAPGYGR